MQTVFHWRQFAQDIETCFLGKNKKNISEWCLLKGLPRVFSVTVTIATLKFSAA